MRDFARLLRDLGPYRKDLVIGALLVLVESAFEMVIPVIMADIIDVGVANRDVPYILSQGVKMGVCALLALLTGLPGLPPVAPMAGGRASARPSLNGCRSTPSPTWTGLTHLPWSPA